MQLEVLGPKAGHQMEVEEEELVVHQKEQVPGEASESMKVWRLAAA